MMLWQPSTERIAHSQLKQFERYLTQRQGIEFSDYQALWRWSVREKALFWQCFAEFAGIKFTTPPEHIYQQGNDFISSRFFTGATLNYTQTIFSNAPSNQDAIIFVSENGACERISWQTVQQRVNALAHYFVSIGIKPGDRVAAYIANIPDGVIAFLACAAVGGVWSSCSPDFGIQAVVDRFAQIKPKVLLAVDQYYYAGKKIELGDKLKALRHQLGDVELIYLPYPGETNLRETTQPIDGAISMDEIVKMFDGDAFDYQQNDFNHPLYILFSSGTTGVPKCITHSAGGALLQHLKEHKLHCDIKSGQRVFYYTTCGWMMWNWLVSALASGATICLYDGSPTYPKPDTLFDYMARERVNVMGLGAKIIDFYRSQSLSVKRKFDLPHLNTILSTGSPLSAECFHYVYDQIKTDVHLASISGGTDIVSCFVLGNTCLPVYAGEIQCAGLAMDVDVFDEQGNPTLDKGELVCKTPFPSKPIYLLGDENNKRYQQTYFNRFGSDIWLQGDFIQRTKQGGFIIYGRSDATLNPGGVRIGTAEIYRYVENLSQIEEALVIGHEVDGEVKVVLFVRLADECALDGELIDTIKKGLRTNLSPKHVPSKIISVPDIPRTRNGKLLELAVKKILQGEPVDNMAALANPDSLAYYQNLTLTYD